MPVDMDGMTDDAPFAVGALSKEGAHGIGGAGTRCDREVVEHRLNGHQWDR